MRLWSLHPKYLDTKGLVALWREGLLALHVLQGKTKGYTRHPQLERFRAAERPLQAIHSYLNAVLKESVARGYQFDASKIRHLNITKPLPVTQGQMDYEFEHLKKKLRERDAKRYSMFHNLKCVETHPIFKVIAGEIETWERV